MSQPEQVHEEKREQERVYFVNGEEEETEAKKLTADTILANARFEPPADWVLSRDKDGKKFAGDELVEIHKDERFTATYVGSTPTS